jgi:predicted O-methyltransferase YrrM
MKRLIKTFLHKLPYIKGLHEQVKKQGAYPAGHYYSPIPNQDEILAYINSRKLQAMDFPDVNLNKENQFRLLQEYRQFYGELPFPEKQEQGCRYYYENTWYSYADAIFLYSFLRKHQPKKIIEVGSGFSSAVMLDTIERFFSYSPEITFIEPYPDRLKSLLTVDDYDQVTIIDKKIQEVPSDVFSSLRSGDLLFIDSSHVVKCGSDLQLLMFDILPLLPSGTFVHFHDVFYPFDYPSEWLKEGRYWNENYFLRAFLSYNYEWTIYFFNTYIGLIFSGFVKENMPLCVKNPGGSLYIRREKKG